MPREPPSQASGGIRIRASRRSLICWRAASATKTRPARPGSCPPAGSNGSRPRAAHGTAAVPASPAGHADSSSGSPCRPNKNSGRAESIYLAPQDIRQIGPASVLLGKLGAVSSPLPAPSSAIYLAVRLKAGESWRYDPPADHTVCWVALSTGSLAVPEPVQAGELAVFAAVERRDRLPRRSRHRIRSWVGRKPSA